MQQCRQWVVRVVGANSRVVVGVSAGLEVDLLLGLVHALGVDVDGEGRRVRVQVLLPDGLHLVRHLLLTHTLELTDHVVETTHTTQHKLYNLTRPGFGKKTHKILEPEPHIETYINASRNISVHQSCKKTKSDTAKYFR